MAEHGRMPTSEIESPGGLRELFYADGFAGLPLVLAEYGDGGFATEAGATTAGPFEPALDQRHAAGRRRRRRCEPHLLTKRGPVVASAPGRKRQADPDHRRRAWQSRSTRRTSTAIFAR